MSETHTDVQASGWSSINPPESWPLDVDRPLWALVGAEFRSFWKMPMEVPVIVVINIGLCLGVWFLISPSAVTRYTAIVFLPVALAAWAFADVPSTNLFGNHPDYALQYLNDPHKLRRMITVKNIALWILVTPVCVLTSLGLAPGYDRPIVSAAITVAILVLPFAYLGLAACMAPLLPFHPMDWQQRLRRKDTWVRYALALGIAYFALTMPAAWLALGPFWLIQHFFGVEQDHLLLAALLMTPWVLILWRLLLRLSTWITSKRKEWLIDFLEHPERG